MSHLKIGLARSGLCTQLPVAGLFGRSIFGEPVLLSAFLKQTCLSAVGIFPPTETLWTGWRRQEGYFHYLFGVQEEGYYGALDLRTKKAHLFMPRLPDSYAVWMGKIRGTDDVRLQYAVDSVSYVDEMPQVGKLEQATLEAVFKCAP